MEKLIKIGLGIFFIGIIYVLTLPLTYIFQLEAIQEVKNILPKPHFYIEEFRGASLKDRDIQYTIDDWLKSSKTDGDTIYALGHKGFFVANNKTGTIRIYKVWNKSFVSSGNAELDKIISSEPFGYYKRISYEKLGEDKVYILKDKNDLVDKEKLILEELMQVNSMSGKELDEKDIIIYKGRR